MGIAGIPGLDPGAALTGVGGILSYIEQAAQHEEAVKKNEQQYQEALDLIKKFGGDSSQYITRNLMAGTGALADVTAALTDNYNQNTNTILNGAPMQNAVNPIGAMDFESIRKALYVPTPTEIETYGSYDAAVNAAFPKAPVNPYAGMNAGDARRAYIENIKAKEAAGHKVSDAERAHLAEWNKLGPSAQDVLVTKLNKESTDAAAAAAPGESTQPEALQGYAGRYNDIIKRLTGVSDEVLNKLATDEASQLSSFQKGSTGIMSDLDTSIAKLLGGYDKLSGDVLGNLGKMKDESVGYNKYRLNEAMSMLEGAGEQARKDINERYNDSVGNATASLAARGLLGTGVVDTATGAARNDAAAAEGRLNEALRGERLNTFGQFSGDVAAAIDAYNGLLSENERILGMSKLNTQEGMAQFRSGTQQNLFGAEQELIDLLNTRETQATERLRGNEITGSAGASADYLAAMMNRLSGGEAMAAGNAGNVLDYTTGAWADTLNFNSKLTDTLLNTHLSYQYEDPGAPNFGELLMGFGNTLSSNKKSQAQIDAANRAADASVLGSIFGAGGSIGGGFLSNAGLFS